MKIASFALKILENKFSYIFASFIGIYIGIYHPSLGNPLGEISHLFLNILQLCLLPIVVTSVALSTAHFILAKSKISSTRVVIAIVITFIICSFIGAGAAYLLEPGKALNFSSSPELAALIEDSTKHAKSLSDPAENKLGYGLLHLMADAIPQNMFASLSESKLLQVVFFSVIIGIGLGKFIGNEGELMSVTRQIRVLFYDLFDWFLKFFPLVVICILAKEVSVTGLDPIIAMGKFIGAFYTVALLTGILSLGIIKMNTRTTWRQATSIMFDPVLVALATQNTNNTIPPTIIALRRFNIYLDLSQLLVPLGAIIGRYGFIIYFGFCIVFALQIYGIDLSFTQFSIIAFIVTMAAISSAGQEELTLNMEFLVKLLTPIGIPIEGILPLLYAVDVFIDPLRTALTVLINCAMITSTDSRHGPILSIEQVEAKDLKVEV